MRQNPTKGASYSEIYHAQTLTLPPLIPEKGAIFCARSGVAPYPDPCLYIHTTAFAVVVCPDDLVVLNPFFVQITGRDTWITTFLVPEQITAAFAWFAQTASGERGEITQ